MFLSVASLRASSPIRASEASLARTREGAAKPRGAEERSFLGPSLACSREARFARLIRRACSLPIVLRKPLLVRLCVIVVWYCSVSFQSLLFTPFSSREGEGGGGGTPL